MTATTIRILIVEDHQLTLEGLQRHFADDQEFQVVGVACDAAEGMSMAQQLVPDIIVLDLHLPKSKGPKSLVQEFCALPARVIVLSAENRATLVKTVMQSGAAAYIVKSENLATVCRVIRYVSSGGKPLIFGKLSHVLPVPLSEAELDILKLLARGMRYDDIASNRVTAAATVKKQCERLRIKLDLSNREQLIAWAINNGFGYLEVD